MKITQNTDIYLQNVGTGNYLTAKSTQEHKKPWGVDMNISLITWEIFKQQDKSCFFRNKLTKGHLDGGGKYVIPIDERGKYIRAASDGITNAEWIKWKKLLIHDGKGLH